MIDLILHNVGVEVALWSVGIYIIAGAGDGRGRWRKALTSGPLIAVLASIVVRQTGLYRSIPPSLSMAIESVGGVAIPLGLLLSGAIIVDFLVKPNSERTNGERTKDERTQGGGLSVIFAGITVRQFALPIFLLGVGWLVGRSASTQTDLQTVMMLQAAMPAAVFPIVLVRLYGQDTETALRVVLWTSLLGMIAIPVWIAVGSWFLGLDAAAV